MARTRLDDDDVGWSRRALRSFLEFVGICGLAVAEPVLASFREGADVFVLRDAGALDVVLFTAAVLFLPALALLTVELLASLLGSTVRRVVHALLLGVTAGIVVLGFVKEATQWGSLVLLAWAVVLGAGAGLAFFLIPTARLWLRYLAVFPAVLGLAFLFASPVTDIVVGGDPARAEGSAIGNPAPVMMIVLDELPAISLMDDDDAIDATQFPNLARLAGDSTWFRNHSAVAPSTPQAVPAILTGSYPDDPDALPSSDEFPDNLFTLLGGAYDENVFEGVTRLCPDDICPDPGGGTAEDGTLTELLRDAVDVWERRTSLDRSEEQVDFQVRQSNPNAPITMQDFIETMDRSEGEPRLDFLHVLYPHQPWFHLPTGYQYDAPFVAKGLTRSYTWDDQQVADAGRQRHLLQLKHADAMVGAILDRMEALGTYDESLIVLTADHGVAFSAGHPIRGLSTGNAAEVMWTPLFVKTPGQQEAAVDDRPVIAVDVLPTIADVLDADIPWETDGQSALDSEERPQDAPRPFFRWRLNALQPTEGNYVEVDGASAFEQLLAAAPPGRGTAADLRFYRFGRWASLVGRTTASMAVTEPGPLGGRLDDAGDYRQVDRGTGLVPAYVSGTVDGDPARLSDIDAVAVAVNGTIGGWSEVHTDSDGNEAWWTMVPEWFLEDGANEIALYEVGGTATAPRLRPIPLG